MWESLDLRKFPRLNVQCDIEIHEAKSSFNLSTVTQNIGAGGVCVILTRQLPRSTNVFVRLHLKDSLPTLECSAKVCWVIQSRILFQNQSQFDTGIEFLDIKPEDRQRIRQIVDSQGKSKTDGAGLLV